MPNGGPDNCGNCDWNKTEGDRVRGGYCELRKARITTPFWTYCRNFESLSHTTDKITPPITGPIYASGIFEGWYTRIPWLGTNEPETHTSGITDSAAQEIIALLEGRNIPYDLDLECGYISAKSFAHKELLKSSGFKWSPEVKAWMFHFETEPDPC